jgi:protein-L-isoaspartate(D-aspartate) O-methyltransferase
MADPTEARLRMVADQIERRGIANSRVLEAMRSVPRHLFVPAAEIARAYDDQPLPIGHGQTISQPYMVALMSEIASPTASERVLEIGTGSGYQTALLATLAGEVWSIETVADLHRRAANTLRGVGLGNIHLILGDGSMGWSTAAPFDIIMVTAAMPGLSRDLLAQLGPNGRLVGPIGESELQTLVRLNRRNGRWNEEYFGECRFVKMSGRDGFTS